MAQITILTAEEIAQLDAIKSKLVRNQEYAIAAYVRDLQSLFMHRERLQQLEEQISKGLEA